MIMIDYLKIGHTIYFSLNCTHISENGLKGFTSFSSFKFWFFFFCTSLYAITI